MLVRLVPALFAIACAMGAEKEFVVAGIRATPVEWDKETNFSTVERYAREAAARGAQMVVTPEGFLEGYVGNDKKTKGLEREKYLAVGEAIDGPLLRRAGALARELRLYLLLGFAERRGERMFNSAVIFAPGGEIVSHYAKSHTMDDEPFNTKGTEFPVSATLLGRWGTLICADRQLPETSRILALKGAQVIFVPAWGSSGEQNDIMMRTRAYENGVWVVFVHPNRCLFINPRGKIVTEDSGRRGDELVLGRIDLREAGRVGPIRFRRPELYGDLTKP